MNTNEIKCDNVLTLRAHSEWNIKIKGGRSLFDAFDVSHLLSAARIILMVVPIAHSYDN